MTSLKINIAIADDHPAVVLGIQHELSGIRTINLVGAARNSSELVDLLSRAPCDILVSDYVMPGGQYGDGMAMLSFLRRRFPELKIIIFTTIDNVAMAAKMMKAGMCSVLSKTDDVGHLIAAIHAVYAGAKYLSPNLRTCNPSGGALQYWERVSDLTNTETEVLRFYLSGMSVNEIAAQLRRSKQTISTQKVAAMRKLGVERDADLFRLAHETGLITTIGALTRGPADLQR
ncbi:two component transcriptional regulator, LuxR family [Burkholderia sp. GAS332]|nr:two component transcriptional regulator, LuxR family [Burkholderia sp. GAS332]